MEGYEDFVSFFGNNYVRPVPFSGNICLMCYGTLNKENRWTTFPKGPGNALIAKLLWFTPWVTFVCAEALHRRDAVNDV